MRRITSSSRFWSSVCFVMSSPKKKKASSDALTNKKIALHVERIGRIVIAWNSLHMPLLGIFECYMGKGRKASAKHLWLSAGTDTAQRQILRNYIKGLKASSFTDDILWALAEVDHLAQYRNAFVHVAFTYRKDEVSGDMDVMPYPHNSKDTYFKNLNTILDNDLYSALHADILNLYAYLTVLMAELLFRKARVRPLPWRRPLMKRPVAQAFPRHSDEDAKKNRQKKNTLRDKQRRASRPKS